MRQSEKKEKDRREGKKKIKTERNKERKQEKEGGGKERGEREQSRERKVVMGGYKDFCFHLRGKNSL